MESLATFYFPNFEHRRTLELDLLKIETVNNFTKSTCSFDEVRGSITLRFLGGRQSISHAFSGIRC